MGGDRAPASIVEGARLAAEEHGVPVVLVGRADDLPDTGGLPVVNASEVIEMGDDPAQGVRRKKDASVVRAAEMVRDGIALAMVSAGNTGAAMVAALLRMGRIKGVSPPGHRRVDPGARHGLGDAHRAPRRRRQRRVPARVARAVRPHGQHLLPPPLRR